jgi:hypothetical protein
MTLTERLQTATEKFWDEAIEGFDDHTAHSRITDLAEEFSTNGDEWMAIHDHLVDQWARVYQRFPDYVKLVPGGP